jgi:hypothetical protein
MQSQTIFDGKGNFKTINFEIYLDVIMNHQNFYQNRILKRSRSHVKKFKIIQILLAYFYHFNRKQK